MSQILAGVFGATSALLAFTVIVTILEIIRQRKDVRGLIDEVRAADRRSDQYEIERDAAVIDAAKHKAEAAAAIVRMRTAEARANQAAEEATKRVVEKVRTAPTARAAAAALDELLGAPILPTASKAGEPGAGGDGA